ncbi:hypothetical protein O9992_21275 [Vibrio lentus]|nr:hypothetical protein [Vibrio lentus]
MRNKLHHWCDQFAQLALHTLVVAEALERRGGSWLRHQRSKLTVLLVVKTARLKEGSRRADAIVVACDKQVDMARFAGKRALSAPT